MAISSIFAQNNSTANPLTTALSPSTGSSNQTSSSGSASASTSLSTLGQLYSQLQQLSTSNPTEFQQVTSSIASQLQTAAQQTSGPQSNFLSNLSNQFQTASQTGTLAAPTSEGHRSGHRHHGGGGGGLLAPASTSSTSSTTGASPSILTATAGYSSQAQSPFAQVSNIIQQALTGAGIEPTTAAVS